MASMAKGKHSVNLTRSANRVLEQRYLWKTGGRQETPEELFLRVAGAVADVERLTTRERWKRKFFEVMADLRFLPNSPTLMNCGKRGGQLSACFVLPVPDDLEGIFNALRDAALIQQSGGGTGFSFSNLRPKGAQVTSGHGVAAGPIGFLRIFDLATETIKQGGVRRGANMAVLNIEHPDVEEFIQLKRDSSQATNFNLSVAVTDQFMNQVLDRQTGALERMKLITECAWECGDPGLIFIDRMNQANPTPALGKFEATNPCGEQPLLSYESCNLGSIRISAYGTWRKFDWKKFRQDIHLGVRFLDNVISLNAFPTRKCRLSTLKTRKIGLGVMGFADLLLISGIPYGSEESIRVADKIMGFLRKEGRAASVRLAKERGAFPAWKGSLWERMGLPKMRNATITTIAPTGTISLIAGTSSGIEPIYSSTMFRNALDGERLVEVHPMVRHLVGREASPEEVEREIRGVSGAAWRPAHEVGVAEHIAVQAIFQKHSDSAVSKTVNLPNSASREEVFKAYVLAYQAGCKGITVFRDGSRPWQVLESGAPLQGPCVVCR